MIFTGDYLAQQTRGSNTFRDWRGGHRCHFYVIFNPIIFTMSARILRANGFNDFNMSGYKFKGFAATLTHFMQRITATITCFIRVLNINDNVFSGEFRR
ncbi:hypothetical protein PBPRB1195 [Photobacterium profundum SS9]|uniref:Uncharacterized protein n=1 Tax=Photobacterium profundum (strain SS9) TaxID=298386 RepID=Q6LI13_PHOPR|nr:hypothetical protein PBPRB1195 [Photobacterium profundum SS9]